MRQFALPQSICSLDLGGKKRFHLAKSSLYVASNRQLATLSLKTKFVYINRTYGVAYHLVKLNLWFV